MPGDRRNDYEPPEINPGGNEQGEDGGRNDRGFQEGDQGGRSREGGSQKDRGSQRGGSQKENRSG